MMNAKWTTGRDWDTAVEDLAAELAEVAYPILLRNAPVADWLELRLELWRALQAVVGEWARHWAKADGTRGR